MENLENGINVFESFRIYGGVIFRFDAHLKRLRESAKSCGVALPSEKEIKEKVFRKMVDEKIKEGFLRIDFRDGSMHILPRKIKKSAGNGIDLRTSSFRMPSPKESISQAKSGNYRVQILETVSGSSQPYEFLFLDENHFLTESRVGNFFMIKNRVVLTPPVASVLNGITREVVIECARESGFLVRETPLTRHEAFNADEAFLTNTSWEILPVRSLDGRKMREEIPGPLTKKLIQCFHRKVESTCRSEKSSARLFLSRTKKV